MKIKCASCKHLNPVSLSQCERCSHQLIQPTDMLSRLVKKQAELEERHLQEMHELKKELKQLDQFIKERAAANSPTEQSTPKPVTYTAQPTPAPQPVSVTEKIPQQESSKPTLAPTPAPKPLPNQPPSPPQPPSEFELQLKALFEPLYDGIGLLGKTYDRFKKEGKLPIFFMTIAGIVAILFGFGYLMQHTLASLGIYEELAKVGMGFLASVISVGIGIRLSGRHDRFKEYASALISLGIILNYLMIYFLSGLGNFPNLSSSLLGFLLIVANTGIAIFLALKFEARIIAVLSIAGGALAPFYLDSNEDGSLYYLYLWLLTLSACFVSAKIQWKTLQYFAFALSALLLEIMVFTVAPSAIQFTVYYHLFAYLFFYYTFFEKGKLKAEWDKTDIGILAANLSLFTWNLYSATNEWLLPLGLIYLGNAALFTIAFFKWRQKVSTEIQLSLFVTIGVLVGFAIPSLFDQSLMGLFWSIEGVMLIYLGFVFRLELVRREGYLLMGIALGKLGWHSLEILEKWNEALFHDGFLNYSVLGLVISGCWIWGRRFEAEFNQLERKLFHIFQELVPLWLASMYFAITFHLVGNWSFNLAILPIFGLVWWGKRFKTDTTAPLGLLHLLLFLVGFAISAEQVQSFRFTPQFPHAQAGILELLACLWVLKSYFKWLKLEEHLTYPYAKGLRVLFFSLLPLIFLYFTQKFVMEWFAPALWISVLMTYGLYRGLKYQALIGEVFALLLAAIVFVFIDQEPAGLAVGILILALISFLEKAHDSTSLSQSVFKILLQLAPYIASGLGAMLYFQLQGGNAIQTTVALAAVLVLVGVFLKEKYAAMRSNYVAGIWFAYILNFIAMIIFAFEKETGGLFLSLVVVVVLGMLLHNKGGWYNREKVSLGWKVSMVVHQVQVVAIYSCFIYLVDLQIDGPLLSVLLVLHAIVLIFIAMKQSIGILNKLSIVLFGSALLKVIFHDIRDFDTAEKVVVFIILGLILLGASFAYVKLKKNFEAAESTPIEPSESVENPVSEPKN